MIKATIMFTIGTILLAIASVSFDRKDRATCQEFVSMKDNRGFYITKNEKSMCDYLGVDISGVTVK